MKLRSFLPLCLALNPVHAGPAPAPAEFRLAGAWEVEVVLHEPRAVRATLRVTPEPLITVSAEKYSALPVFNPQARGYAKGARLQGVQAQETTTPGLLDPDSIAVRAGPQADAAAFQRGADYDFDPAWGTIGRLPAGAIAADQPVFISYRHNRQRLDAVVLTRDGRIVLRPGEPRASAPIPPATTAGERHLGNIWQPGLLGRLGPEHLFPILETAFPETARSTPSAAERLLPQTMRKLKSGERLRILAWGDSVTVGTYLPDWERNRWQEQFVARLRARFPQARIELVTEAWGGRNTSSYLKEPPGSEHNYREKVLAVKPDLVVSEFVNDSGLKPPQVEERYAALLADFKGLGAEWIILTPHYTRPDWMGLTREREIDDDPRPYVAGLREFAARHPVALADAARRYGRLWRQGLPHSTLLLNSINHPDARGMRIFADALMELFP